MIDDEGINTSKEILQDTIAMYCIFGIQKNTKNPLIQELYGYLGIYLYAIYLQEILQSGWVDKDKLPQSTKKLIEKLRTRFAKKGAKEQSETITRIAREMGIDFSHYMYDMVLTVDKGNADTLLSINFGLWDLMQMKKGEVGLFNDLASIPEDVIRKGMSGNVKKDQSFYEILDQFCKSIAQRIERQVSPQKYMYASGILFNKRNFTNCCSQLILTQSCPA